MVSRAGGDTGCWSDIPKLKKIGAKVVIVLGVPFSRVEVLRLLVLLAYDRQYRVAPKVTVAPEPRRAAPVA